LLELGGTFCAIIRSTFPILYRFQFVLFEALTAFLHQLLVNVPSYRAYFIRSGLLFDFIELSSDFPDSMYWMLLDFASPTAHAMI
jgi:hypothetical protein